MEAVLSTLVGGGLAVVGTMLGIRAGRRTEYTRWRRDLQIQLATDAMAALQALIRVNIDIGYSGLPPRSARMKDTPEQHELRSRLESELTRWNSAMYAVLIGADALISRAVRELDREVDKLMDAALRKQWDRDSFREERRLLGEVMAEYVELVRREAGLPRLGLTTVWTWADG